MSLAVTGCPHVSWPYALGWHLTSPFLNVYITACLQNFAKTPFRKSRSDKDMA